jgi:hypothetical protein
VFGELLSRTAAVEALVDRWGVRFDEAIACDADVTAADRGEVEIGVAKAEVVATETALEVAHRVFEVTGSSSTPSDVGLDPAIFSRSRCTPDRSGGRHGDGSGARHCCDVARP